MTRIALVISCVVATACLAECKQVGRNEAEFALSMVKANKTFVVRCATCPKARVVPSRDVKTSRAEGAADTFELRRGRTALDLAEVFIRVADGSERRLSALLSCPTYANKNEASDTFGDGLQKAELLAPGAGADAACGGPLVERLFQGQRLALPARFSFSTLKPDAVGVTAEWASALGELVRIRTDEEATSPRPSPECSKASVRLGACVAFDRLKSGGGWMIELGGFSKCAADAEAIRAAL